MQTEISGGIFQKLRVVNLYCGICHGIYWEGSPAEDVIIASTIHYPSQSALAQYIKVCVPVRLPTAQVKSCSDM